MCCCSPSIDLVAFKPICEFRGKLVKEFRYVVNTEAFSELSQKLQGQSSETRGVSEVSHACKDIQLIFTAVARSGKRNS